MRTPRIFIQNREVLGRGVLLSPKHQEDINTKIYIRLPLFYCSMAVFNAAKRSKPQTWFRFVSLIKVNRTTAEGFIIGSSVLH